MNPHSREKEIYKVTLVGSVVNVLLTVFKFVAGIVGHSAAMMSNVCHHRSDALSSIGTAIGIGGAIFLGQQWTVSYPIVSIVVGAFILKVAYGLLKGGLDELMELSLPDSVEGEFIQLTSTMEGVHSPHGLRTRRIGNSYAIELHIYGCDITLRQAHDKATEVE